MTLGEVCGTDAMDSQGARGIMRLHECSRCEFLRTDRFAASGGSRLVVRMIDSGETDNLTGSWRAQDAVSSASGRDSMAVSGKGMQNPIGICYTACRGKRR